jgi:hypothetical protein
MFNYFITFFIFLSDWSARNFTSSDMMILNDQWKKKKKINL